MHLEYIFLSFIFSNNTINLLSPLSQPIWQTLARSKAEQDLQKHSFACFNLPLILIHFCFIRALAEVEGYSWIPTSIPAGRVEEWMKHLPDNKVPKLGGPGESYRETQLLHQVH